MIKMKAKTINHGKYKMELEIDSPGSGLSNTLEMKINQRKKQPMVLVMFMAT